jgi:hypothetical protein
MVDFVAGVPLAVGVGALHLLNDYLDDRRIAIAWYGEADHRVFTSRRWIKGKVGICISHVFSVRENESLRLIADSLESSQGWYMSRIAYGGECCWLPIYRSFRERHPDNPGVVDAQRAIFSLGAVGSLPAARMDLWGLIVMAYANGAHASITLDSGSYVAVLRARHFVLTVRRQSLTDQAVAHIEPRERAFYSAQPMNDQAWKNLLEHGHSFSKTDYSGWPLYTNLDTDNPPANLVNGELDVQLKNEVLDDTRVSELKERLITCTRQCRTHWNTCYKELKDRSQLMETHNGDRSYDISDYDNLLIQFKERMERKLNGLVSFIEKEPENAIEHAQNLRLDPIMWYDWAQSDRDWKGLEWARVPRFLELMRWHGAIIVLVRFLILSTKIDSLLSSRGTGDTVLLADSAGYREFTNRHMYPERGELLE